MNKKLVIIVVIITSISICSTVTLSRPIATEHYHNLQVLPKDISTHDLQEIMADDLQDGLGVTCGFCHANGKDGHGLDFASDEKPEKEISRRMMRMTLAINKKNFKIRHPAIGSPALVVTCNTCHRGQAFPEGDVGMK